MNKLLRLSIPATAALMTLFAGLLFVHASQQAVSASAHPPVTQINANLLVTTLADEVVTDGQCSLREALLAANTNSLLTDCGMGEEITDTISFIVEGSITVTSPLTVSAGGPLVVDGGEAITISGGNLTRVWWVENSANLTLMNLSVIKGYITGGNGAGLFSDGRLTVKNSSFSDNHATESSGCGGGAIHSQEDGLVISGSTFVNNTAICVSAWGGAVVNQFGTALISDSTFYSNTSLLGGAVLNFGSMTVTNSTFSDNLAYHEGGAIHNYFGNLTLINSTLSANHAEYSGGLHNAWGSVTAISSTLSGNAAYWGAGIMNQGLLTVTNTTLSGNDASSSGGGIFNTVSGTLTMTNVTISSNAALLGGALYNENTGNTIRTTNSIFANSMTAANCWGEITDAGYNISSDDTCSLLPANGSLPSTDPQLSPLGDYGGPTWTHALLPSSPAIDMVATGVCPASDQRGVPRPQDGDDDGIALCDTGAYEAQVLNIAPMTVTISGPEEGVIDQSYIFTALVEPFSTTLPLTYTWQVEGELPVTHTGGLTDTAVFMWQTPGLYTITVSAANAWGVVSDTHPVYITDQPIIDLVAHNDSPTPLGEPTTLSATISGGTNVVFDWEFGDGQTGSGQVVTHTYAEPGVYIAIVTASNSANSLSASTEVIILQTGYWQYLPFVVKNEPLVP